MGRLLMAMGLSRRNKFQLADSYAPDATKIANAVPSMCASFFLVNIYVRMYVCVELFHGIQCPV